MARMFVVVLTVFPGMLMVMAVNISPMGMLMAVLVRMFMRMGMSMLVAVLLLPMAVFVRMAMGMVVRVNMLVLVLSFHGQYSLQKVEYFTKALVFCKIFNMPCQRMVLRHDERLPRKSPRLRAREEASYFLLFPVRCSTVIFITTSFWNAFWAYSVPFSKYSSVLYFLTKETSAFIFSSPSTSPAFPKAMALVYFMLKTSTRGVASTTTQKLTLSSLRMRSSFWPSGAQCRYMLPSS